MSKERQVPGREVPIQIIIKKKGHGGGHHGGAWKVAFADFMTAMFALFLVLWLVNQSSDVKSAIAGYFQDPLGRADEFGSSIMPGEGAQAASVRPLQTPSVVELRQDRMQVVAEQIKERIQDVPNLQAVQDHIEVTVTEEGLTIQLLEDSSGVFFESGRSTPRGAGQEILALLGSELGKLPNRVRIDGHTDARPYSGATSYSNWELSADRANAARRILTQSGLDRDQVVQIRGCADRDLKEPNNPYSARNRRVTITLLLDPETESETAPEAAQAPAPVDSGAIVTREEP